MGIWDNNLGSQERSDRTLASDQTDLQEHLLDGVQILLIEDEPDIAELLRVIFEGGGAKVVGVTEAEEALNVLKQLHPDVLVCNICLPDHNGDWLIQQIRADEGDDHIPAIAVTSYTREVCHEKLLASGFERYLPKISDPDELIATVANLIKGN